MIAVMRLVVVEVIVSTLHPNSIILVYPLVVVFRPTLVFVVFILVATRTFVMKRSGGKPSPGRDLPGVAVIGDIVFLVIPLERILIGEIVPVFEITFDGKKHVGHTIAVDINDGAGIRTPRPRLLIGINMPPVLQFLDEDSLERFVAIVGILTLGHTDNLSGVVSLHFREDNASGHDTGHLSGLRVVLSASEIGGFRLHCVNIELPVFASILHTGAEAPLAATLPATIIDALEVVVYMESEVVGNP